MPIEGPLRELGIHDVFQLLDLSRKTGVLRVTSELRHNAGTISFEGGAIVFAEIRSNPHPLGALLLRTGKISEADLERADFEVAKTLFGLESAGVIVLADPGTTKHERTTLAADLAELVARAEDALARRDLEEARGAAEQAAGVHPHDPAVHLLLGRIALVSGRGADAVEELRRALRLDPLAVAAHRVLGYALAATGRFGEAVEQWDQWERLAARSETELAQLDDVRRAKAAAQTLAGTGTHA